MLPENCIRIKLGILDRLRRDPGAGRGMFLPVTGASVAVVTLATVSLTALTLTSSADLADRLAAAGDVLVGATLLLAVVAAVVALLAYAVSTGLPDIYVHTEFKDSPANNPLFIGKDRGDGFICCPGKEEPSRIPKKSCCGTRVPTRLRILLLSSVSCDSFPGVWVVRGPS